ncbi:MAG: hypothetical protein K6E51_05210, partial [Treponema sp.]|nr:hypothetical protein [Treponema sp.]
ETWVEKTSPEANLNFLPYKFTAKEMDEETGLYYYGARYLDPKYSRWISTDPALGDYLAQSGKGEGGIYNSANLNLYHYANNNPVKYTDPDGEAVHIIAGAIIGGGLNAFIAASGGKSGREIVAAAAGGAVFGGMLAATGGLSLSGELASGAMAGAASYFAECAVAGDSPTAEGASLSTLSGTTAVMAGKLLEKATSAIASKLSGSNRISQATGTGNAVKTKCVNGIDVIQDNSIIDPSLVDSRGRSNIERMQKGLAPIGSDGESVNLHHVDQTMNGPVKEMTATSHQQNYSTLHSNTGQSPSQINRKEFDSWRKGYWQQRANDF